MSYSKDFDFVRVELVDVGTYKVIEGEHKGALVYTRKKVQAVIGYPNPEYSGILEDKGYIVKVGYMRRYGTDTRMSLYLKTGVDAYKLLYKHNSKGSGEGGHGYKIRCEPVDFNALIHHLGGMEEGWAKRMRQAFCFAEDLTEKNRAQRIAKKNEVEDFEEAE